MRDNWMGEGSEFVIEKLLNKGIKTNSKQIKENKKKLR